MLEDELPGQESKPSVNPSQMRKRGALSKTRDEKPVDENQSDSDNGRRKSGLRKKVKP
jgi:hypothetical protein